jgi:NAD(P)-dependent dehydrogenase (short-subunit alcohol dehydrogenase family)
MDASPSPSSSPLAVITGAASGIGRALTTALLARGIDVVTIDRDTPSVDSRAPRFSLEQSLPPFSDFAAAA